MVCVFLVFVPLCLPLFCSWLSLCLFLFASLLFICLSVCLFTCSRFGFFQFKSFVWVRLLLFRRRRRRCRHYQKRTQSCCPCRCCCCCCCYFSIAECIKFGGKLKITNFGAKQSSKKINWKNDFFAKCWKWKNNWKKLSWVELREIESEK